MKIAYIYDFFPEKYGSYLTPPFDILTKQLDIQKISYNNFRGKNDSFFFNKVNTKLQNFFCAINFSPHSSFEAKYFSQFDIIHFQHSYLWRKLKNLDSLKKDTKVLFTLRGGDTYIKPWIDPSWKNFYASHANKVDKFIVMSENQKLYLNTYWKVPFEKICVIPISCYVSDQVEAKFPNSSTLKLISAFRMTWEKNISGCIELANELKLKGIDFKYDIYGDGGDYGQLYYLIEKYKLTHYVFPKGYINHSDLKKNFKNYDFLIQLSISESLSATVLEAQAAGVPCVVSDVGGLVESVINNKTGIISTYNNYPYFAKKIEELWKSKNDYFEYSTQAIEHVRTNYDINLEVKKLSALYADVMKN